LRDDLAYLFLRYNLHGSELMEVVIESERLRDTHLIDHDFA